MSEKRTVGFIGVGVMGNPIARHLIAKGNELVVYDRSPAGGAGNGGGGRHAQPRACARCAIARLPSSPAFPARRCSPR